MKKVISHLEGGKTPVDYMGTYSSGSGRGGKKKVMTQALVDGDAAYLDRDPRAEVHSHRLLAKKYGASKKTINRVIKSGLREPASRRVKPCMTEELHRRKRTAAAYKTLRQI